MDWDDLWVLLAVILASPLVLSVWALLANRRTRRRLDELTDRYRMVEHRLFRLAEAMAAPAAPPAAVAPASTAEAAPVAPPPAAAASVAPAPAGSGPVPAPPAAALASQRRRRWEQALAESWLVWLGGGTVALGGAFLVKLSIDYGLLGPAVRVVLAALLGIALAAGADRLARREPREADWPPDRSSAVAQALAAAGAAIVFAAIYAGYQLYGLLPGAAAFALLGLSAAAATALSLRHGPYVAALGLVGAYVTPALVASDAPHALPLFLYLAIVTAAALALVRQRAWWWLAWLSLAGAMLWPLLWLSAAEAPETPVVALYLLAQFGLFAALRLGVPALAGLAGRAEPPQIRAVVRTAFGLAALAVLVLVHADNFGWAGLGTAFLATAFLLWFGARDAALDDAIFTAGALLVLVLASWQLPVPSAEADLSLFARPPVETGRFLGAAMLAVLLLGGGGFARLRRAAHPGRWAALSAAAPVIVLIVAYWRLHGFVLDIGWSGLALTLAACELAAAASVVRRIPDSDAALAAYAVGVLGGTVLSATFALSTAWLSVALALHLPAMGWIEGRVRAPVLRRLALAVAAAVLLRLLLNPYVLQYPLSATPVFNWLLYGYGVPALAFIVATRQFGGRADDLTVAVLEAGSILFTAALLTLELRHALYARLDAPLADTARDATQPLLWLGLAALSLWLGRRRDRPVLRVGGVILWAAASAQTVLWHGLAANPLFTGEAVGRWLLLDALTLAFALPALGYALIAWAGLAPPPLRLASRLLAAALAFVWLSLEIRHAFHGEFLDRGPTGEAEWYGYSAAWLAFAGAALAAGLARRREALRRAALAGIGLVAAKVFLSDMAALTGILRALSFLGLGGALIAIGYAYRRLQPAARDPSGEPAG
jgi:uncharacterized membrane protein